MYCQSCKKFFIVKRTFRELFKNKKLILCPECISRYQLNINHLVLPLDRYNADIVVLYDKMNLNFVSVFAPEYSKIIKKLIKSGRHVVIIDVFNEKNVTLYEQIVKILDCDVTFVSFLLKTLY